MSGGELLRHLLENIISFDLLALNVTFHFNAQSVISDFIGLNIFHKYICMRPDLLSELACQNLIMRENI